MRDFKIIPQKISDLFRYYERTVKMYNKNPKKH